ncbi:MAG: molybdopterin molybdotransferase MoeA [Anaerolineae bacterium]|nr:molybdopterin molybdotransferase MoeA [Anaerolineae bacterium]
MPDLLSVDDALARILKDFARLPAESVPLLDAHQRVLVDDLIAEHDLPSFANSSMDGYAVRAADLIHATQEAPTHLRVTMDIPAGVAPQGTLQAGEAARIMTGAALPEGADTVVPVEDTDATWQVGEAITLPGDVGIRTATTQGANVRLPGENIRKGATVLSAGTRIRAAGVGVLAGLGQAQVSVVRRPRVAIVSTGDELLAVDQPLETGKIRDTNSYTLAALVTEIGAEPVRIPAARDDLDDIRRRFREALAAKPDVILSSAGVSVGAVDLVRKVLDEMGHVDLWRINIRPGKPLAYGKLGGVPFFGLPGNPVSAMVTFDVFVRPALLKLLAIPDAIPTIQAVTGEDIASDGRQSYIRVTLRRVNGRPTAYATGTQSSGALLSMVLADGLLIIPEGVMVARQGESFAVRVLRVLMV